MNGQILTWSLSSTGLVLFEQVLLSGAILPKGESGVSLGPNVVVIPGKIQHP